MDEENKKTCNGYEAMYTFLNEEDFHKHLEVCEECTKEHAKIQRVTELIQEAKPYIKEKQRKSRVFKNAAALFVIAFATLSVPIYMAGVDVYDNMIAQHTPTAQELGLPVDEYGFLYVE